MDFVRRPKEAFLLGPSFSSTNLDKAGHFGPFHGSNRRRSGKQMITLDLNHFGFQRAGRPERRKGQRRRRTRREEKFQARANLNGGELDCEKHLGHSTHKGSHKEGVLSRANLNGGELDIELSLRNDD